jgi:flagellar basal body-associated protein FliL
MAKKKNKKKVLIVIGYIILIIGLGIYIYLTPNKDVKPSKKPDDIKKEEKKQLKENLSFSLMEEVNV